MQRSVIGSAEDGHKITIEMIGFSLLRRNIFCYGTSVVADVENELRRGESCCEVEKRLSLVLIELLKNQALQRCHRGLTAFAASSISLDVAIRYERTFHFTDSDAKPPRAQGGCGICFDF
jgi:hypothetical protein